MTTFRTKSPLELEGVRQVVEESGAVLQIQGHTRGHPDRPSRERVLLLPYELHYTRDCKHKAAMALRETASQRLAICRHFCIIIYLLTVEISFDECDRF